MTNHISQKLEERDRAGSTRKLLATNGLVDFVSNDYLGLSRSKTLFERIKSYDYSKEVNINGSTGSRLLAGNSATAQNLENKLAHLFKTEAALLFNSGYVANLALISCVPQRGDTILYDSLSHVCLKEGAFLSKANRFPFRHNDCEDLEAKLKQATGNVYIIIESVYSMDGDLAPFGDIIELAEKYEAKIIVDEAHSTGLYGEAGSGKLCALGLEENLFARVHTFGKAMGVHGAVVCGSKELINYLINFARPFIYTTALPLHSLFSIDAAFGHLSENIELQKISKEKIFYFNSLFNQKIGKNENMLRMESNTPIQPIVVPGNARVKSIAESLQKSGFDVRPILSPTVKEGSERLRISIHTHNTEEEIAELINELAKHA
ncbi:MAG: 8-amino-7-oxononanoate synthase [Reichenbachiella sp.]|uniref:aminotransferase class I/II-fold pyridoxal phosphate-dependent enzyme n=1 Tax=Reichenbachiella sp. TaxID=2184521 RepID=UPI0029675AC9|nr:8-amino-7-oxononanoate synthase [Reichenbachiella sp.]MDW3211490.1 8-amino-7-oxononanoate synthase [Reichenbachiella sp.]